MGARSHQMLLDAPFALEVGDASIPFRSSHGAVDEVTYPRLFRCVHQVHSLSRLCFHALLERGNDPEDAVGAPNADTNDRLSSRSATMISAPRPSSPLRNRLVAVPGHRPDLPPLKKKVSRHGPSWRPVAPTTNIGPLSVAMAIDRDLQPLVFILST